MTDHISQQYPNITGRELWLESKYPVTIIHDRYGGTYSGGAFVALPNHYHEIPINGPDGSDPDCAAFWRDYKGYCGIGYTPYEAFNKLVRCIEDGITYDKLR